MKQGDVTTQDEATSSPIPYVANMTYDLSLGAGSQPITGVGFRPTYVIMTALLNGDATVGTYFGISNGLNNSVSDMSISSKAKEGTDDIAQGQEIMHAIPSINNEIGTRIESMDPDGFTLVWLTPSNNPTGIMTFRFMAFK